MKRLKFVAAVIILIAGINAYSQSGWQVVSDSIPDFYLEAIQMTSVNTGYACGTIINSSSGSFMRTTNGGLNWQRTDYEYYSVDDISFLNDLTGYAIGYAYSPAPGNYTGKILKTTDGGNSWARIDSIANGIFFKIQFYDLNTGFIAGKNGQAFVTTNGGINWIERSSVYGFWNEPQGVWCLDADKWFIGDGDRLISTTNQGLNWVKDESIKAWTFHFLNHNTGIIGGYGKLYKTTNSGVSWNVIISDVNIISKELQFTDNNTGYNLNFASNKLSKTTNGGYNWVQLPAVSVLSIYSLSFVNSLTGYVACDYGRIYKTTNGGTVFVSNLSVEVPERFELGQNFPNPFNQSTIFNLQCSMKSDVCVKVFDAAGREVQTLVNETLAPGTYQVRFDGSGLASGLYYYSMSVDGKRTAVKKMIMVK